MNADGLLNGRPPSSVQLFVVIDRVFGKDDSISHRYILANFWPEFKRSLEIANPWRPNDHVHQAAEQHIQRWNLRRLDHEASRVNCQIPEDRFRVVDIQYP